MMKMLKEKFDKLSLLRMVPFIKENGIKGVIRKMVEEFKYGQMAQDMMVSGKLMWPKDMVV